MATKTPLAIDKTIALDIYGSSQRVRICAARAGLPPLLIVQGGPGLPLLHEVAKFQRLLHLETDFEVYYWEQRGCGSAPRSDVEGASMAQQVEDLRTVLRWIHDETGQRVTILAISLGGTFALQAAEHETDRARALVVISPDTQTTRSDAFADAFLREEGRRAGDTPLSRKVKRLEPPPYLEPAAFQRRVRLLIDLGTVERGKTFTSLMLETSLGMLRAYGPMGTVRAFRNMNSLQRKMLPEALSLDLLAKPPRIAFPVHYVFGEKDVLTPAAFVKELPAAVAAPATMVTWVPNAGHHVHFDHPDIVRSIVARA